MSNARQTPTAIWTWPIILGVVTLIGLIGGLVGDDVWDWVSWLSLGSVTAVCIGFSLRGTS